MIDFLTNIPVAYEVTDKDVSNNFYIRYMLNRTQNMFEYKNLPDTIPAKMLELYLQMYGTCIIAEHEDSLYAFYGALGGMLDEYYRPTQYTVANPYFNNISTPFIVDKTCVLCYSDSVGIGLYPIYSKYAQLMTENDITMRIADINTRITFIMSAQDDITKNAANEFLKQIENGTKIGVIAEKPFLDGVKVQPVATSAASNMITQLIELQQYLKASLYNEIGLQSNYNMKRESLNSNETESNIDALLPLSDDMMKCRKEFVGKVNAMYNQNISVDFASAWKHRRDEISIQSENSGQPENSEKSQGVKPNETE